ncbi:MAG: aquaporin [Pirellulales bacterium]
MSRKVWIAEFLATFILVFSGTAAIVVNDVSKGAVTHVGVSLVFGLVVMAMIYAVGDTSGAHINPAVTIAFWVGRRLPGRSVPPYLVSQVAGAFAGSGLVMLMFKHPTLGGTHPTGPAWQSFVLEVALTGILMFVVLGVSSGAKEKGILAGVAVGGVIAFEALLGGPISGASMNPARSLAPAVLSGKVSDVWIYLAAPILGAVLGVFCHKATE